MHNQQLFRVSTAAKLAGFPGGEKKFFEWLRTNHYLLTNNEPAQRQIDRGWFVLIETRIGDLIVPTPKITIKGLAGLQKVIQEQFPVCPPC